MKNTLFIFSIALHFQSCSNPEPVESPVDENIRKVETSLVPPVYFEGDSMWTIEERMKHYGVPGVSIAVIRDNKIAWMKGYGVMDKESKQSVTTNTLFQAASISKPVSAYGALTLVEMNKLKLDEDVNTYLKSWKLPENEFTREKKVTLKHLLSHTGGIMVHGFLGYSPGLPVPTLLQVLDGTAPANSAPIRVDKVPGESFRYSGGGYCIMQQMMMDATGKPFPQIMKDLVLHPLEMNSSTYDQPLKEEQLKTAATGYLPDGSVTKGKRHTYPEMAPAGLWTTAEDLAKFAITIQLALKGERKTGLSKEMTKKMLTPVAKAKDQIGLGIFIQHMKKDLYFGHGGWNEGFCSNMIAHIDKGYGVVVLTNSNQPQFIHELIAAVALTYKWDNYVPVYKKMKMDPAGLAIVAGRYHYGNDELIQVYQSGNSLFKKQSRADSIELFKVTDSTYIGRDNRPIEFKVNPKSGQIDLIVLSPNTGTIESTCTKMKPDEKIPFEFLEEGNFEQALAAYRKLLKADPKDPAVSESNLNQAGYNLLNFGKIKLARDILKVNTLLYPNSSDVYDSYAEACMKNKDMDLAVANYRKSLELNPKNSNAVKMLEEIQKNK